MHAPARSELNAAFSENKALLQAVAIRLCGNAPDAYDLVQDTFERALRAGQPRSLHNLRGWLLTILRNLFFDRCRSRLRQPMIFSLDPRYDVPIPTPDYEPEWLSIPSEQVEEALCGLDERFRTVFELHCVHEVSYEEIAKTLNIPKNTVGTRISRARSKVSKKLHAKLRDADTLDRDQPAMHYRAAA